MACNKTGVRSVFLFVTVIISGKYARHNNW